VAVLVAVQNHQAVHQEDHQDQVQNQVQNQVIRLHQNQDHLNQQKFQQ